jgi:WD40 repeat protein
MVDSHTAEISDVGYNDLTSKLLTAGKDSSIKIWEAESMTLVHEFNTSEQDPPTRVVSSKVD